MASILFYLVLPVAGLILIWLRREFLTRILIHVEGFYLPISCPTFGRGRTLVDWARARLPQQWSSHLVTLAGGLADFWKDGSLLCTLINSAIPGACANPYRHWKKPPVHAQDVAYKYLGIIPVFTESDFSSQLSPYLEVKLLNYLYLIRKSIFNLEKEKLIYTLISPKFVARGMGLYTAEQHKSSEFYIYSKYGNVSFFNIEVNISGPYSTGCRTTVLEYLAKESKTKNNHQEPSSDPSASISVKIQINKDRVRVGWVTKNCGIHEISLSCNKESIMGSPFYVNVIKCAADADDISKDADAATIPDDHNDTTNEIPSDIEYSGEDLAATNHNDQFISDCHTMEISKYLKELSNSHEQKVNSLLTSRDKIWANCPDYFTRENYLYFQKLVDSSFRKICRVTRAHPKLSQKLFSSASPICCDHIAPEGYRKLSVGERRKAFALQKSSSANSEAPSETSSFSINENKEEPKPTEPIEHHKPLIVGANPKEQITDDKCEKKKRSLQKLVKEKKLFWENVFQETKGKTSPDQSGSSTLKHVDSLHLLRRRPLSKSLGDLRKIDSKRKLQSRDDNMLTCCRITLEDRTKLYLENARLVGGEIVDRLVTVNKVVVYENRDGTKEKALGESVDEDPEEKEFSNSKSGNLKFLKSTFCSYDCLSQKEDTFLRNAPCRKNTFFATYSGFRPYDGDSRKNCERKYFTFSGNRRRKSILDVFDVLY